MSMFTNLLLTLWIFFLTPLHATPFTSPNPSPGIFDFLRPVGATLQSITLIREPPAALKTTHISPACKPLNQGALFCCETIFDGRFPLVVKLTDLVGYQLTPDTINGVYCRRSEPGTCQKVELCCQVDYLSETPISDIVSLALFCRYAPKGQYSPGYGKL